MDIAFLLEAGGGWYGGGGGRVTGSGGSGFVYGMNQGGEHLCTAGSIYKLANGINTQFGNADYVANPDTSGNGKVVITKISN